MFGKKKLKQRLDEAEKLTEECREMRERLDKEIEAWHSGAKKISAIYHITESDTAKFGANNLAMEREAKHRLAGYLGRRILKELGVEEIGEDGLLLGYRIEIEARRAVKQTEEELNVGFGDVNPDCL